MAGESLKMADERDVAVFDVPSIRTEFDKENNVTVEGDMKTVSAFSPFMKTGSKSFKILSDDEIQKGVNGGSTSKTHLKNKSNKRKSLATIQPTSDGQGKLTGNGREQTLSIKEAFKRKTESKHVSKNIDVKVTPATTISSADKVGLSVATPKCEDSKEIESIKEEVGNDDQLIQDAILLMKQTEKVDDSYWKNIAEERREALEEALTENEKLYEAVDGLTEENTELKQTLSELECYKILYQNLLLTREQEKNG